MKYIILAGIVLIISSSTFKLKRRYEHHGADNFYLEFITKETFELKMYSCTYSLRIIGDYRTTTDTIYLDYKSFETLDEDHKKWIKIDSTNADYSRISDSKMIFLNKFNKLVRMDKDRKLMPYEIRRAFIVKNRKNNKGYF